MKKIIVTVNFFTCDLSTSMFQGQWWVIGTSNKWDNPYIWDAKILMEQTSKQVNLIQCYQL